MLLISRRRHGQAGTRYLSRGLDDEGNVANFVETEQVLTYGNLLFSHVQVRGSVPLFWQQRGLQAHTSIKRGPELTVKAFDKHLSGLVNDYKNVIFINLLQKGRSYENELTTALEVLFNMCVPKQVKLTNYDFHTETKGDKFYLIDNLIVKVEDKLVKDFGYYCEERETGRILI